MNFSALHNHSHFSFLDGFSTEKEIAKRAKEVGATSVAITEHGSVSSFIKFRKACKENGIKPIYGVEAYTVDSLINNNKHKYHCTLLAKNQEGYRNLMKLVTKSWQNFYYKPTMDWKMLKEHSEGLVVLSGCIKGKLPQLLLQNRKEEAKNFLDEMKEVFKDGFYIEVMPLKEGELNLYNRQLFEFATRNKARMVATLDSHYPTKEDSGMHDIMLCLNAGAKMNDPSRMRLHENSFYIRGEEEIRSEFKFSFPGMDFNEAILNASLVGESCNADIPVSESVRYPYNGDKEKFLYGMLKDGLKKKGLDDDKRYQDRLDYEFNLIIEKKFVDYFLIIWDIMEFAAKSGIVRGPARGSSAGSLCCFLLNIVTVDPIKYGLYFERFISVNRSDLPDIDMDFEDARRDEVKQYLKKKYGADRVASLATFANYKGKMCIGDIARAFSISKAVESELKSYIHDRSGGDSRTSMNIMETLSQHHRALQIFEDHPEFNHAVRLEGRYRQLGVHAAGVIVSEKPLTESIAIYERDGENISSCGGKEAEEIGLLKIDILGLNTLTALKKMVELVKERHGIEVDLYNIDIDDPKIYEGFKTKKLFGIFQFEGTATQTIADQIKPDNFDELTAVNALSRPGPLHSGGTTSYLNRKWGREKVDFMHPEMEKITGVTRGIIVYQEQVMAVMRDIGELSWENTSIIRKIMSKSSGVDEFNKFKIEFMKGALKKMDEKTADAIWKNSCTMGAWAFNLCITGDTKIRNASPNQYAKEELTIKELFENCGYTTNKWKEQPQAYKKMLTVGVDVDGKIRPSRIKNVFYKGKFEVYELETESGKTIKGTINHRMLAKGGYKEIGAIKVGDCLAVDDGPEIKVRTTLLGKGWRKGRAGGAGDFKDHRTIEVQIFKTQNKDNCCEHCGGIEDRMEVHHVTRTPPNSILEWLCVSCHKKAEYKIGRTKVWQKGNSIGYEKVIRKTRLGKEDTYDIEMEEPSRPSFVANGLISHNSHSVSYSFISAWTMFFKVYYPIEFYAANLMITKQEEKLFQVIKNARRDGIDIKDVDLNKSKSTFCIDGDGIRIGFGEILGVGEKAAMELEKNQPYRGVDELRAKTDSRIVNKRIVNALEEAGVLDGTTATLTLFGEYKPVRREKAKLVPLSHVIEIEKLLGKEILATLKEKFFVKNIEEIAADDHDEKCAIVGVMIKKNLKNYLEDRLSKGEKIDLKTLRRPDLLDCASLYIEDDTDMLNVGVNRFVFPDVRSDIYDDCLDEDVFLAIGKKMPNFRTLFVKELWNISRSLRRNDAELTYKERVYLMRIGR